MPQMGESIAEGTIVKWLKQVGDKVGRDEPLFEISTDKVDAEIPSPAAGVLSEIKVPEGQTVPINTVVAVIGDGAGAAAAPPAETAQLASAPPPQAPKPEETLPADDSDEPQPGEQVAAPELTSSLPSVEPAAGTKPEVVPPHAPERAPEAASVDELRKTRSSPLVRKIAQEHGVEISQVPGTGIGGRVTKEDILSFIEKGGAKAAPAAPPAAAPAPPRPPAPPAPPAPTAAPAPAPAPAYQPPAHEAPVYREGERVRVEPMSVMRKRIAEHMVASRHTSAHVQTVFEMEMTKIVELRNQLKTQFEERDGVRLTFTPLIVKAVVESLKAFPIVNASIQGDNIVYKQDINIGLAVALDWGLIVPVIKNADEKSLLGIARATSDLSERARTKRLKPDEVQDGTFTITNPGIYGGLFGTPIINQPQVGILGVGAIEKRPVVIDDAIAIRSMCYMCLSFDHRLIDGAVADQFMAHLKKTLATGQFTL
jgi:pyruvate dehydrogenase E2 component (dihydrolipoamide acetyltransferase)